MKVLLTHVLAVLCAAATLALSGCVMLNGSELSATDARDRFYQVLDGTQSAIGGAWTNRDDPTPRGCTVPVMVEGATYPGLRLGPAPSTASAFVEIVRDEWERLGYAVSRTTSGAVTELRGERRQEVLVFRVGEDSMTIAGESECRPTE
jgi:hypothetical protein